MLVYLFFLTSLLITSSLSLLPTTITLVVNSSSNIKYNGSECGNINDNEPPCIKLGDAGNRARSYLLNNYTGTDQLIIQLTNSYYNISNNDLTSVFGNLFGFSSISINNNFIVDGSDDNYENIIFDGSNNNNLNFPLLTIKQIDQYQQDSLKYINIKISNFTFTQFNYNSTIFDIQTNASLLTLFQIYNSKFNQINGVIINSISNNANNNNNNNNNYNNNNSNNNNNSDSYENNKLTLNSIIFVSCNFNRTNPTLLPTFKIINSKLQILSCTIRESKFSKNSFISIENGGLRMFASTIRNNNFISGNSSSNSNSNKNNNINNKSNSNINNNYNISPFISLLNCNTNIRFESNSIFQNNNLNSFLSVLQTKPIEYYQNQKSPPSIDYLIFNDLDVYLNQFLDISNNSDGFIGIYLNGGYLKNNNNYNNFTFKDISIENNLNNTNDGESGTPLFSLFNGVYNFNKAQFKDRGLRFSDLDLNNSTVSLIDSVLFSSYPIVGKDSNITSDTDTFISYTDQIYLCDQCFFNGEVKRNPNDLTRAQKILIFLLACGGFLLVVISSFILYRLKFKKIIDSMIEKRTEHKMALKFSQLDHIPSADENQNLLYVDDSIIGEADIEGGGFFEQQQEQHFHPYGNENQKKIEIVGEVDDLFFYQNEDNQH